MSGDTYDNIVQKSIIEPLGLAHTTIRKPEGNFAGVIPQGDSLWDYDLGEEAPYVAVKLMSLTS